MEKNKITVFCENNGQEYQIPTGSSLKEFKKIVFPTNHQSILGELVSNEVRDLHYEIYNPKYINFIDVTTLDGYSVYLRSLIFVLYKAVYNLYRKKTLVVEYHLSNGVFCRLANKDVVLTGDKISEIKAEMQRIIDHDYEIMRRETPTEEAIKLFNSQGLKDKELLLSTRGKMFTSVYSIDGTCDYFYGTLAPSTGCLKVFDLMDYKDGMLLMIPDRTQPDKILPFVPQEKLFSTFSEFKRWGKISEVMQIGHLNQAIEHKHAGDMIKVSEALHEKKISQIADLIKKQKQVKVILIAGPSSSGKTTFGKRLAIQLLVNGIKPVNLSLDNYFVNREDTPKDEKGEYDFETIDALDINTFNDNIMSLLRGEEVEIPKFSFETGQRFYDGEKLKMSKNNVIESQTDRHPAPREPVQDIHIRPDRDLYRQSQHHQPVGQPPDPPHGPRSQIPELLGPRHPEKVGKRPFGRTKTHHPLPGRSRCHVQLRPRLRTRSLETTSRSPTGRSSGKIPGTLESQPPFEILLVRSSRTNP